METGSEEHYVRCRRCHGTFEATLSACPRCGTAYIAPTAGAAETTYAEKFQPPSDMLFETTPAARPRRGMSAVLMIGVALLVVAAALTSLAAMGAFENQGPTPTPPNIIISKITPTPVPTKPPAIANTIAQLTSDLNLHVTIRTTIAVDAKVKGRPQSAIVSMEIDCAGGNEAGTTKAGALSTEWRLVDGVYYQRTLPSGKWAARSGWAPAVILSPMFQMKDERALQYDGQETKNGILAEKLETTDWWTPDTGKVAGVDISPLGISPAHVKLVLWVDSGGTPQYATFRAWTDATDGTNLLDISSTYEFSKMGIVDDIVAPGK